MSGEPSPPSIATRDAWREVLTLLVPNRLALTVVMWIGMVMWEPTPQPGGVTLGDRPNAGNLLLDGWLRWDVHWYWHLAREGYTNLAQNGAQRDTVFFPLYPLLVRIANLVIPDTYAAGLIVSNLALLGAAFVLFRLSERYSGPEAASRAVLALLTYPWSFYLSTMYSESVFALAVVAAFYLGEQKRWVGAGLCAAAAGATRVLGLTVLPGLLLLYLEQIRFDRRAIRADILGIGLGLLGPGAHLLFLQLRFGDALLFAHNQGVAGWGGDRTLSVIWDSLTHANLTMIGGISLEIAGLAAFACYRVGRTMRWGYALWGVLYLLGSLRIWDGIGRFAVGVFPLFLWAGVALGRRGALAAWVTAGALLQGVLMLLFAHWRYVG